MTPETRALEAEDAKRLDWLEAQTKPHHGVVLCGLDVPGEEFVSVQRVDHFHNPHKVEWCHEGPTLRSAIDNAMRVDDCLDDCLDDGWATSDNERGQLWSDSSNTTPAAREVPDVG
jgi:hypothetical protein